MADLSHQVAFTRIFFVGADLRVRPQPGRTLRCVPIIEIIVFNECESVSHRGNGEQG